MTTAITASYQDTLAAAKKVGASKATDAGVMALFCAGSLQLLCGAVSPALVWRGAVASGMTARDLSRLAATDPMAISDLQWIETA